MLSIELQIINYFRQVLGFTVKGGAYDTINHYLLLNYVL